MHAVMEAEYCAWRDVVEDFRKLGIDVNEPEYTPLCRAICLWGERLVDLRIGQTKDVRERATRMAEQSFRQWHPEELNRDLNLVESLVADAARAEELFDVDELERFIRDCRDSSSEARGRKS